MPKEKWILDFVNALLDLRTDMGGVKTLKPVAQAEWSRSGGLTPAEAARRWCDEHQRALAHR